MLGIQPEAGEGVKRQADWVMGQFEFKGPLCAGSAGALARIERERIENKSGETGIPPRQVLPYWIIRSTQTFVPVQGN
jgi:hypothetical protein